MFRKIGSLVGSTIRKFGDVSGKILRVATPLAQPLANVASNVIDALPLGTAGGIAKSVLHKTADFISSGKASRLADRVSDFGKSIEDYSGGAK